MKFISPPAIIVLLVRDPGGALVLCGSLLRKARLIVPVKSLLLMGTSHGPLSE